MTGNDKHHESADAPEPTSPHYQPLVWSGDESDMDELEIEAHSDDWIYQIWSVNGENGELLGYQIRGGDVDESDNIGSLNIDGERGERTLEDAKAAAQANYAGRYCEAERLLFDAVSGYQDDDGHPLTRRDAAGRIFCRVELMGGEVEIAATLSDYADSFDVTGRCWIVCLRSILVYLNGGDWLEGMHDDMRHAGVSIPDDSQ